MPPLYSTAQIADRVKLTPQTVRAHLRELWPDREEENWWRFEPAEYEEIVAEIEAGARLTPGKPRRGVHRIWAFRARMAEIERGGQAVLML